VSELGDLLELLYRADSSWRTIRLSAQEWSHVERTQRAFERYYAVQNPEGGGHVVSLYGSDARHAPHEVTTEIRLWAAADGRRRIERESAQGSHRFVFDGNVAGHMLPSSAQSSTSRGRCATRWTKS
jgi:hypothetical protein